MHLKMKCDKTITLLFSWCAGKISDKLKMSKFKIDQVKSSSDCSQRNWTQNICRAFKKKKSAVITSVVAVLMCVFQGYCNLIFQGRRFQLAKKSTRNLPLFPEQVSLLSE